MKNHHPFVRLAVMAACLSGAPAVLAQTGPSTASMPEAFHTGTRIASALASQPFGVSVITADEIKRSGAPTVTDAIMRLLGVGGHLDFFGGGEYTLDLRGFGKTSDANQVVVVDGVRMKEFDFDGVRLSAIPVDSVERIEVIRGSAAVLYGAGATGGAIVVTTKARTGVERKSGASIYGALGTNSLNEARVNGTWVNGGFSLDANALRRNARNYRSNYASGNGALSLTGQWKNDWLRLGLSRSQDALTAGLPGFLTPAQYQADPALATTPKDAVFIDSVRHGLFAEATAGDWQLFADAGRRDKKLRNILQGVAGGGYDVKAIDYALRAVLASKGVSYANSLTLGTDFERWQRDTPAAGAAGLVASQVSRGLYVRDEFTLASTGTVISAGVRADLVIGHNDNATFGSPDLSNRLNSWELGINQPLDEAVSVYARTGRSTRAPTVEEFNYTPFGVVLKPQVSRDVEFGSRYASGPFKLDARVYRSALTDEIGYDLAKFTSAAKFGANVNYDRTRRSGVEFDGRYAYTQNLDLRVNATFRKSTFVQGVYAGNQLVRAPGRILSMHADWRPQARHLLSGGITAVSSQRLDVANVCAMPGYSFADVRYAYQWDSNEISLGVTNVLGSKFFTKSECDAAPGATTGTANSIFPEQGRALVLALRAKF